MADASNDTNAPPIVLGMDNGTMGAGAVTQGALDGNGAARAAQEVQSASEADTAAGTIAPHEVDQGQDTDVGGAGEDVWSFADLVTQANGAQTLARGKEVLLRAVEAGLGAGEFAYLQGLLASALSLEKPVISGLARDAKATIRGFGLINSYEAAANAFTRILDGYAPKEGELKGVVHTEGRWCVFEGGHYASAGDDEIARELSSVFKGSWVLRTERDRREVARRLVDHYQVDGFFNDAAKGLPTGKHFVRYDVEKRTLVAEPLTRHHKARFCLGAEYSRTATAQKFLAGLKRVLPDAGKIQTVQELFGAIAFQVTPPQDSVRTMAVLWGPGGSGKSTFIDVARLMLPPELVVSVPPKSFGSEFARARLEGARLNYCTELAGSQLMATDILKQVTAREPVTARHRYGQEREIRPIAFHVVATNELPHISDNSGALDRRLIVLHFDRALGQTEMDSHFLENAREELPGIIAWAAEGAERLMSRGYFELPPGHAEGMLKMKFQDDVVALFVHTQLERAPGRRVISADLRAALSAYAFEQGYDRSVAAGSGVMRRLAGLMEANFGASRSASNNAPFYIGVALKARAALPPPKDDLAGL